MKKRSLITAVSLLFTLVILVTCSLAEPAANVKDSYKIGISLRWATHPFVTSVRMGIQDCAKEWENKLGVTIETIVTNGDDNDPQQQVRDLEDLSIQEVDAVAIFPGDSKGIVPTIEQEYYARNVPVVITDIGVDTDKYTSWVCPDYYACGAVGGEAMAKAVEQGGKIAVFNHNPGAQNCQERCQGFYDKCKELGLEPLDIQIIDGQSPEDGKKALEDAMTANPDLAGVFVGSMHYNQGFISAKKEANNDKVVIVCFDLDATSLEEVRSGDVAAAVVNDPYGIGYEGMNQMMYALTGQTDKIQKRVTPQPRLLTMDNASEFENDPQVKLTQ